MTAAITGTPLWSSVSALTRAVDGELAGMDSGPAPLATVLQTMADRDTYALWATNSALHWSGQMYAAGTAAAPDVYIGPIGSTVMQRVGSNVWESFANTFVNLGIANVEGLPANLAASTWYYVYCWNNAGALAYQISTTPPTLAASPGALELWKRGAAYTHRYLACFVTDGAGNPIPVRRAGGRYTYVFDAAASSIKVVDAAPGGGGWVTASCAAVVPPHAFVAYLHCDVGDAGGTVAYAKLATTPGGATFRSVFAYSSGGGHSGGSADNIRMVLDASQRFDWDCAIDVGVYVLGFEE